MYVVSYHSSVAHRDPGRNRGSQRCWPNGIPKPEARIRMLRMPFFPSEFWLLFYVFSFLFPVDLRVEDIGRNFPPDHCQDVIGRN